MKKASEYFHGKEGYNCAQAILKAFQTEFDVSAEMIDEYSAYGKGRAEGGLCGALYAAHKLLDDTEITKRLKEQFTEKAGSPECRKILKLKKLSCYDCVDLAAQIIDEA